MRVRFLSLLLLASLLPVPTHALVSEGRPGVPYFGHVLFLQQKVIENDQVVAVSLAYADPLSDETDLCNNSVDVFGGLELFHDIPERQWVVVDYELQSILIADGFTGDADVFQVTPCDDMDHCMELSKQREAVGQAEQIQTERPRAKTTVKANFDDIQRQLEIGRKLVKAARCRGCHSIESMGPGHAPSLTWKRFKYEIGWLERYLQRPYRMRPAMSDLMMLKYTSPNAMPNLQEDELKVVAKYLANVATASAPSNQFRRELWQNYDCFTCHTRLYKEKPLPFQPTAIPAPLRKQIETSQTMQTCLACHPFGDLRATAPMPPDAPNVFATDLLLAFEKLTLNYLTAFLANPSYLEPQTRMPDLGLSEAQIDEIRAMAREVKAAIASGTLKPVHLYYELEKQTERVDGH